MYLQLSSSSDGDGDGDGDESQLGEDHVGLVVLGVKLVKVNKICFT